MKHIHAIALLAAAGSLFSCVTETSAQVLFFDNFDSYGSPSTITTSGTANGYTIRFSAPNGIEDFTAIFGFDYSTVTYPVSIPSAPNSIGGTTKGLYLTVNKDAVPTNAAVNLYPVSQSFTGNFSLKFDVWINWTNLATSTEHVLFGINHSGNVTNQVAKAGSDGLFSAMNGDGGSSATSATVRDFSLFQGQGTAAPLLLRTNTFTFGPAPLLGTQFDNANPGFTNLFPSKTISGYPTTPAGTPGLGWVTGEYRQQGKIITWLLNSTIVAQYTNATAFTNGNIMLGYDDVFNSLGDTNNFVIFDNVHVDAIPNPLMFAPQTSGGNFSVNLATISSQTYNLQASTDLTTLNWFNRTNFTGNGNVMQISVPITNNVQFFRVITQP